MQAVNWADMPRHLETMSSAVTVPVLVFENVEDFVATDESSQVSRRGRFTGQSMPWCLCC